MTTVLQADPQGFDLVLTGGRVYDGTGAPPVLADIAIKNGRIADVSRVRRSDAARVPAAANVIDVSGKVVCPGFIDIHRHSDLTLSMWPGADSALLQGITTEVIGNCGLGPAPALHPELAPSSVIFCPPDAAEHIHWRTFGDFLDHLSSLQLGVNVAALIPHGALRVSTMGMASRLPTAQELEHMRSLLREGLEGGAVGFSTGLEYAPGNSSNAEEIVALATETARHGGLYATHVRDRWDGIVDGVKEGIATAERAGCALQLSHLTARRPQAALNGTLLELVHAAADRSCDIAFDAYPYDWGPGPVQEMLPAWVLEGGPAATLERLRDRKQRHKIRDAIASIPIWTTPGVWNDVMITLATASPGVVGKTLQQLSDERKEHPTEIAFQLLLEAGEDFPAVSWVARGIEKSSIYETVRDPLCALGSDAATQGGPLAHYHWHPGAYGWAARVLTELVATRTLSFEEAVRRMTTLPASRVGLQQRGAILSGFWADLVVIDPGSLRDNSDYVRPNRSPDGIVHVLVNGELAVRDGQLSERRSGRLLRARH
jgi:N-acyl-D-amino-acid deacylase